DGLVLYPREIWKYCVSNVVPPNIATPTAALATTTSTVVALRSRRIGMIGSGARHSTTSVSASAARVPPRYHAVCADHQGKSCPAKVTQTSGNEAVTAMRPAPR